MHSITDDLSNRNAKAFLEMTKVPDNLPPQCDVKQVLEPLGYESDQPASGLNPEQIISTVNFKAVSEVIYGSMPRPSSLRVTNLTVALVPCLMPGVVIFVEHWNLKKFEREILPIIQVPFRLVSGDSDTGIGDEFISILDSPFILHWWALNCLLIKNHTRPRLSCLPIGINQWQDKRKFIDQVTKESGIAPMTQFVPKNNSRALASYSEWTNKNERKAASLYAKGFSQLDSKFNSKMNASSFYRLMYDFQFIVSPPGKGVDCYRTWEAIFLGCIPIIKSSALDVMFKNLPVMIVKDWPDMTEELAIQTGRDLSRRFSSLYLGYWQRQFYAERVTGPNRMVIRHYYSLKE